MTLGISVFGYERTLPSPLAFQDTDSALGRRVEAEIDFEYAQSPDPRNHLVGDARMAAEYTDGGLVLERSGGIEFGAPGFVRYTVWWQIDTSFEFRVPNLGAPLTPVLVRAVVEEPDLDTTTGQFRVTLESALMGFQSTQPLTEGFIPMLAGDVITGKLKMTRAARVDQSTTWPPTRITLQVYAIGATDE